MFNLITKATCFWLLLCQFVAAIEDVITPLGWENQDIKRSLDLRSSFTTDTYDISIKNIADAPLQQYLMVLPNELTEKVALFTATVKESGDNLLNCYILKDAANITYGIIELPTAVAVDDELDIIVKLVYNTCGKPYPEMVKLGDKQMLNYKSNKFPNSPYFTKQYEMVAIAQKEINELVEHNQDEDNTESVQVGGTIRFGPYENIEPYSQEPLNLIYERLASLRNVINLERDIWVSHWASTVQFQEYYEMTNKMAKLEGGFSRLKFMESLRKTQLLKQPYDHVLDMALPDDATEHFFYDKVGMVSTSDIRESMYILKPRYPIMGGWFYNFTIGWTNQLSSFLTTFEDDKETFILKVPVLNGPSDTVYDNVNVTVYLPEGAQVLDASPPFGFHDMIESNEYSYFDLGEGHVKLTFTFKNVFTDLGKANLLVKYKFTKSAFYKKPLSIACYFLTALMGIFVVKTLNLSIN